MNQFTLRLLYLSLMVSTACEGQVDCNTLDVYTVPGKWVWAKSGYGNALRTDW